MQVEGAADYSRCRAQDGKTEYHNQTDLHARNPRIS